MIKLALSPQVLALVSACHQLIANCPMRSESREHILACYYYGHVLRHQSDCLVEALSMIDCTMPFSQSVQSLILLFIAGVATAKVIIIIMVEV